MSYLSDLLGDGYHEGMTEDEISTALESAKVGVSNGSEINNLRQALSKANSEAADYKKQLRSRQTAEEAAAAEQKTLMDQLAQENKDLKRSIAISDKTAQLLGIGYGAELASATALAMIDGDLDTVIKNQSQFLEAQKQNILADRMKNTPRPVSGSESGAGHYQKLIDEAQARGDFSAVAYYTRLTQEANNG
jgi:hypothetical protein